MPTLTGNTALDVAIGLAFIYLLFSVLCAAVQEAIAGIFDLRAATLERGLQNLLEDDGKLGTNGAPSAATPAAAPGAPSQNLTNKLLGHGLIRTLYKGSRVPLVGRRGPSYIPAPMFALALLDLAAPPNEDNSIAAVRQAITDSPIPGGTKSALLSLASGAAKDRDQLRAEVERWFDQSMSRVSGWYKRKTQIVICLLSLLVAVGLNVNTVSVADRLINDDSLRSAVVQEAVKSPLKSGETLNDVADQITQVQKLGIPFGWNKAPGDPADADLSHHLGRTIGGWLLTFLALSLGAPFWFDALSKLAGLRNTGPPPKLG